MPIPTPGKDESKDKFIARCMGNDVMNSEFPDSKQRYAVCQSKWKAEKEKDAEQEETKEEQKLPEQLLEKALENLDRTEE